MGSQAHIRHSAKPALALFCVFLAGSLGLSASWQFHSLVRYPRAWTFSVALLLLVTVPVLLYIRRLDQFGRTNWKAMLIALLWGAFVAVTFSVYCNGRAADLVARLLSSSTAQGWSLAIGVSTVEEPLKAAGLLVLFFACGRRFSSPVDGLVYGSFIGLAYQMAENQLYFISAASGAPGGHQFPAVLASFAHRVLLGGLVSHTLYTGLIGFGFGYLVTRQGASRMGRYAVFCLLAGVAWGAHLINDSPLVAGGANLPLRFFVGGLATALVVFVFWKVSTTARHHEWETFARLVPRELETGVLEQEDVTVLLSLGRALGASRDAARKRGRGAARLLRRLRQEEIKLVLFHADPPWKERPQIERQREKVRRLKAEIAALPAA